MHDPPVQSSTQSPPAPPQLIAHEIVLVQVCWQSPPGQSVIVQVPPVQSWMQSPEPRQLMEHEPAPEHVWWQSLAQVWLHAAPVAHALIQSPPGQVSVHVAPAAQPYWQSPLPGQVSVHAAPAPQAHAPPSHANPVVGRGAASAVPCASAPASPAPPPGDDVEPPHAARKKQAARRGGVRMPVHIREEGARA